MFGKKNKTVETVDDYLKKDLLELYILGLSYDTQNRGGMQADVYYNPGPILNGLYSHYDVMKNDKLISETQRVFEKLAGVRTFSGIYKLIELETLNLKCEESGVATFKLDNSKILSILSNNLKQNKEFFMGSGQIGDNNIKAGQMMELINDFNTNVSSYGHKVI